MAYQTKQQQAVLRCLQLRRRNVSPPPIFLRNCGTAVSP